VADDHPDGVRRMLSAAYAHGLEVKVRRRPPANSLPEAATLLGIKPADIAKTLVIRRTKDSYLFVLVAGDRQLAWPKLRSLLGVSKLALPQADEALEATGYERGTITPIGSEPEWPVVVDSGLSGRTVALGAGAHGFSAFVAIDDLVAACAATVADVTDAERPPT
jgi:Cys-tRNA(Pro) deacylase